MESGKGFINPSSVLVIGASGYIGFAVAIAFRRAGYFVYGLIRNENRAALLQSHEIIPVVADAARVEEYRKYIQACPLIVDCANSMEDQQHPEKVPLTILKVAEEESARRDPLLPPKTFIYTSGIMVYGTDPRIRDEAWPIGKNFYSNFRRKVEEAVTHSEQVAGIVLRPGWVFGGTGGGEFNKFFSNPDKLVLRGRNKDRCFSWIHINDLAEAYVLACNKASVARGMVFNITNNYDAPKHADLALKAARLAGYKGELHWEDNKTFTDEFADQNVVLNSLQANTVLGFTPKNFGLMDNLGMYYETHRAAKVFTARSAQ